MGAVAQVIRVHDSAYVRFLDRRLERGEINLAHGALANNRVRVVAVELRIISHEVFDRRADALALHVFDIPHRDARGEELFFTDVFETSFLVSLAVAVSKRIQQRLRVFRLELPATLLSYRI